MNPAGEARGRLTRLLDEIRKHVDAIAAFHPRLCTALGVFVEFVRQTRDAVADE